MTTTVTIELTDHQVALLRRWAKTPTTWPPDQAPGELGLIAVTLAAALPPEPVRLTIELPADIVAEFGDQYPSWQAGDEIGPKAAAVLRAVVEAARAHQAGR